MHEHSYKFNHLHKENTSFSNFTSISLPNNCLVFRRQEEENENGSRKGAVFRTDRRRRLWRQS